MTLGLTTDQMLVHSEFLYCTLSRFEKISWSRGVYRKKSVIRFRYIYGDIQFFKSIQDECTTIDDMSNKNKIILMT